MEGYGRLKIMIGVDPHYCAECGSPDMEDGCSNPSCWRARENARLPVSLIMQQVAIRRSFPSSDSKKGFMHRWLESLHWSLHSPVALRPRHAGKPA